MATTISVGILTVEDPRDPALPPIVTWPAGTDQIPQPANITLNPRAWAAWQRRPPVRQFLDQCGVPAEVDRPFQVLIDDQLLARIDALCADSRRWAWLPWADRAAAGRAQWLHDWAHHAYAAFGDQARIGFS